VPPSCCVLAPAIPPLKRYQLADMQRATLALYQALVSGDAAGLRSTYAMS